MLGMVEGNNHPYSWSAIINGYNPAKMAERVLPIAQYLGENPFDSVRIPGARVTHVWTDQPAEAPHVAAAALIDHVVSDPRDVIGHVDAVIISTDDGDGHVARARPFIEAGLPVFVDKPLATNVPDLAQFLHWQRGGAFVMSSSGMRYAAELPELRARLAGIGELRLASCFTSKTWERYGIHCLEPLCQLLGPGLEAVSTAEAPQGVVASVAHRSGVMLTIPALYDAAGSFGVVHLYGTKGHASLQMTRFYAAFRAQMVSFVRALQDRAAPFPFAETVELMGAVIAGRLSRERGGARVAVADVLAAVEAQVASLPSNRRYDSKL
ncbi:MAG: Gfo/Idh/MocA family oxidoreductase [Opitutaceae bacterium]|nr:Gfo/Idh/MocA family oxidoreductase [Opitutaceae bacterium]